MKRSALAAFVISVVVAGPGASQESLPPAVPLDPVTAIIEALKTHQVVAFGELHGNAEIQDLRVKLFRDPRLPEVVHDIVYEFGMPNHQDVIDRFVAGDDVPHEELERVWTDTGFGAPDGPAHERFYRTVREVNATLPASKRIRVFAGWPTPLTMEEEAAMIRREILDNGRNALVVYGALHFPRKPLFFPITDRKFAELMFNDPESVPTVAHLEAAHVTVFSIYPQSRDEFAVVQPNIASWQTPSLALIKGTRLGAEPFGTFAPRNFGQTIPNADGKGTHEEHVRPDPARSGLMQEQYDAVLVLRAVSQ